MNVSSKEELIRRRDLITQSLENVQQTQQSASREVRGKDLEITNINRRIANSLQVLEEI